MSDNSYHDPEYVVKEIKRKTRRKFSQFFSGLIEIISRFRSAMNVSLCQNMQIQFCR